MSFLSLYYHIVFSTKNREPVMRADWRPKLYGYVSGTIAGLDGRLEIAGGMADHIHLLVRLRAVRGVAEVVRETKKASSVWIHRDIGESAFAWQEGYAAFSVSPSAVGKVRRYIEKQEEHHRKRDFLEELKILLKRSGVEFDERYLG